ncbi:MULTISPECIES: DUF2637 domain-containing protein [Mycobacteroides]|jgi:hypothetical protein|uniref:DUF2637 domain-containing protein n=1 Tax=Mycobacteroides TaxID=670516 RepID=UPI0012FFFF8B|nr:MULTISPECIES: DUF2637 domain-containing protein [Mycobacteroides]MBF9327933.1 DUF2637 domain-containing protein [Mycobacteroides chelonae]MBF9422111.1 DUF2637 domain-containing protein [Mycobacteroides chelonae]
MSVMTSTELAEAEADRQHARRFFWWWLGTATALTLVGNTVHAVLLDIPPTAVKIGVNVIPPVIAFAAIHGIQSLARAGSVHRAKRGSFSLRESGGPYVFAVCVTALLALAAAILSYSGLYAVAVAGGLGPRLATLWPLTIDAGIAVSTISLMVLRPLSGADERAARLANRAAQPQLSKGSAPTTAPRQAPSSAPSAAPHAPRSTSPDAPATPRPASPTAPQGGASAPSPAPELVRLAEKIVESRAVRQPVNTVARILAMSETEGRKAVIERQLGVHHSVVTKVLDAAEAQRRHGLAVAS